MTTTIALLLSLAGQAATPELPGPAGAPPAATAETTSATAETQATAETPPLPATVLEKAEQRLAAGEALEVTALLVHEQHAGRLDDPERAAALLARAADVLADRGDVKAAAVAADAAWQLEQRPLRPRLALLLAHYAQALSDGGDIAGARAIAERALLADPDNAEARALVSSSSGLDTWTSGHLTLGGGAALGVLSLSAFVFGLDVERAARGSLHDRATLDGLMLQRGAAAAVAWPTAVGSVVATGLGLALIMSHDPGPTAELPAPFLPLAPSRSDAPPPSDAPPSSPSSPASDATLSGGGR